MTTKHLAGAEAWSTEVPPGGLEVRVLRGTVWVTMERDPEDHVLVAPATFAAPAGGRLAMEAFTVADVEVAELAPHDLRHAA